MDNALVHQKDVIIDKIDSGDYEAAIMLLAFVKELWESVSYGYKWRELKERGIVATSDRHWKHIQALRLTQDKFCSL